MALWGISQGEDFGDLLLPLVNTEEIDRLLPFCQNLRSMKFASIPYHIMDRGVFVQARIIRGRPRLTCWQTWSDPDSSPTVPLILQENPLKYHLDTLYGMQYCNHHSSHGMQQYPQRLFLAVL
jgi:hypothetical protein